ncbi:hypothetical protein MC885_006102 [Smutsia gigantea]|nr:hypothetical protein MC885_006102 [Smutsia gigantea]
MAADRREGAPEQSPLQPQKNDLKMETSLGAQRALPPPSARRPPGDLPPAMRGPPGAEAEAQLRVSAEATPCRLAGWGFQAVVGSLHYSSTWRTGLVWG